MIQDNTEILKQFSKEFNLKILASEFEQNSHLITMILNGKLKINTLDKIIHKFRSKQILEEFVKFNYINLIEYLLINSKIEEECIDNYLSIMDKNLFEIILRLLEEMKKYISVSVNDKLNTLEITCPILFREIIWYPISQIHNAMLIEYEHLSKLVGITKHYLSKTSDKTDISESLFINSKVATSFSYFILAYVGQNLGIPLKI